MSDSGIVQVQEAQSQQDDQSSLPSDDSNLVHDTTMQRPTSTEVRRSRVASATDVQPNAKTVQGPLKGAGCDSCKIAFEGKTPHSHEGSSLCDVCFDLATAKFCVTCKGPINCFSQSHKYYSSVDGSKNWHDYCIQCRMCKTLLLGESKRFKHNDMIFCAECYDRKAGNVCYACSLPIFRKSKKQLDLVSKDGQRHWHEFCLKCVTCGKSLLRSPYFCHETGGTFCADCFDAKIGDTCCRCKKHLKCYSQQQQKCLLSDGSIWHDFCLRCDDCGKFLADKTLFPEEGALYCDVCYDARTCHLCYHCKRAINTYSEGHKKYSSKDGTQHWHEHCLTCWLCNRSLAGRTIHWRDNRMYCPVCRKFPLDKGKLYT